MPPRGYAPVPGDDDGPREAPAAAAGRRSPVLRAAAGSAVCAAAALVALVASGGAGAPWLRGGRRADVLARAGRVRVLHEALRKLQGVGLASFFRLDLDNDGNLTFGEFNETVAELAEPLTEREARYAFRGFDLNRDGKVQAPEFVGAEALDRFNGSAGEVWQALAELPTSRNGRTQLGRIEAASAGGGMTFEEFKDRLVKRDAREVFLTADKDQDGAVQLRELLRPRVARPALSWQEGAFVLNGLDIDRDGEVSLTELECAFMLGHFFESERALDEAEEALSLEEERLSMESAARATPSTTPGGPEAGIISVVEFERRMLSLYDSPRAMLQALLGGESSFGMDSFSQLVEVLPAPLSAAEAAYAFRGFDADGDGRVTASEFLGTLFLRSFFRQPGALSIVGASSGAFGTPARTTELPPAQFQQRFSKVLAGMEPSFVLSAADTDGDGSVSMEELGKAFRISESRPSADEVRESFVAIDADGDARVSESELQVALTAWRAPADGEPRTHSTSGPAAASQTAAAASQTAAAASQTAAVATSPAVPTTTRTPASETGQWTAAGLMQRIGYRVAGHDGLLADVAAVNLIETWDLDGDDLLSADEFFDGGAGVVPPLTPPEAHAAFLGIDTNEDHRLSAGELQQAFETGTFKPWLSWDPAAELAPTSTAPAYVQ